MTSLENYSNETDKYYLNSQRYLECQLITAINAATCLMEVPIKQYSAEYERLVDLCCARIGVALNIEIVWRYLRLAPFDAKFCWENVVGYLSQQWINTKNPIEFNVRNIGRHSILAVDCDAKKEKVKVLNYTDSPFVKNNWISWKDLVKCAKKANYPENTFPKDFRVFKLDPWYIRQLQIERNHKIIVETEK